MFNILSSVLVQLVSIVVGLVIPKLIIATYGSHVNGLISSTNQVVGYFGIIEGGVAAAAGASLYKPFAENNQAKINEIMTAVKIFYKRTGIIFGLILSFICIIYPVSIQNQITFGKASYIMFALSLISVFGYLVFNKYNMILVTDQKHYITLISSAVLNLFICIIQMVLMLKHVNIIYIVSVVPILSLIRLFFIRAYIRRHYTFINYNGEPDYQSISQKWNALSMNISQMCKVAIPIFVLSIMYDLRIVSVYTIYSLLFHVGSSMIEMASNSVTAIFGNILAKESTNIIKKSYDMSETLIVMVIAVLSGCFLILTKPFIAIYIGANADVNYQAPILILSFIINEAVLNLRFSPKISIKAAGKLKEARNSGIVEIVICMILTPIFCYLFGYQAVLFGSILSGLSQTIYLTKVSYRKVLEEPIRSLYKKIIVNILAFSCGVILIYLTMRFTVLSFMDWFLYAFVILSILSVVVIVFNYVLLKKHVSPLIHQFRAIIGKGK
jgi:hypothetical protein